MATPGTQETPLRFFIAISVVALLVALLVGYAGATGRFGGPIPGSSSPSGPNGSGTPPVCEGKNRTGNFTFVFVAGLRGTLTFNGTSPGPCVVVGVGSHVTVILEVSADSGNSHGWDLIALGAPTNSSPVFPGAGLNGSDRLVGNLPGTNATFHFLAATAGVYEYLCEVPGHADAGMRGTFTVVSGAAPAVRALPGGSVGLVALSLPPANVRSQPS